MSETKERERVLRLLRQHGWNTTSFQVLEPDFRYHWEGEAACVAYVDTGSAWVAAGAPIAPLHEAAAVAERFVQAAGHAGRRACFFAIEGRFLAVMHFASMLIGEQPVWQPAMWESTLQKARSLREQVRRARNKGVTTRVLAPEEVANEGGTTRRAIEQLISQWLKSRPMAAMGFLVDIKPFLFPDERRYLIAEVEGRLVGFLAAVPIYARKGWFLEDLLRDPQAPNGTAELLVDAAMRRLQEEGGERVTLGLAPLAGGVSGGLRAVRDWTLGLYNFHGVQAFKAKFRPQEWEPVYLAYPRQGHAALALYDTLSAFAGGSMPRFGMKTLLRAPLLVLQGLAALLLPWTVLLGCVDGARWFPAPWVQWGWVGFDLCIFTGLVVLSLRSRPWLATLLFALVSADAAVSLAEVLLVNLPRARGLLDYGVSVAAVLGPVTAALFLWQVRGRATPGSDG